MRQLHLCVGINSFLKHSHPVKSKIQYVPYWHHVSRGSYVALNLFSAYTVFMLIKYQGFSKHTPENISIMCDTVACI